MNHDKQQMLRMFKLYSSCLIGSPVGVKLVGPGNTPAAYEEFAESGETRPIIEMPNANWADLNARKMAESSILHETLHHMLTDFSFVSMAHIESKFFMSLFNVIEDPYIEAKGAELWSGAKVILERGHIAIIESSLIDISAIKCPFRLLELFILIHLFTYRCQYKSFEGLLMECRTKVDKLLFGQTDQLEDELKEGLSTTSTEDNFHLAHKIFKYFEKIGFIKTEDEYKKSEEEHKNNAQQPLQADPNVQLQEPLNLTKVVIDHLSNNATEPMVKLSPLNVSHNSPERYPIDSDEWRKGIQLSNKLIRPLNPILKAKKRIRNCSEKRGVELVKTNLTRALTDGKCMQSKAPKIAFGTAVSVIVDISSSMKKGARMPNARIAAVSLIAALERLRIRTECSYYQMIEDRCQITPVKTFSDSLSKSRNSLSVTPMGGTPTGDAMMYSISTLLSVREPKKVMFIVTDGTAKDTNLVEKALALATKLNIDVYFINIEIKQSSGCLPSYANIIHVDDAAELGTKLNKLVFDVIAH